MSNCRMFSWPSTVLSSEVLGLPEDKKGAPGLQIGLFNAGGGFQIGLINFNEDGLLPWSLLIHFPVK